MTVGENTQLNGAVIASTADASLNKLDTGTLGFGDIENHAEYEVERRDKHGRRHRRSVRREHGERHAGGAERQRQRGLHHEGGGE